MKREFTRRFISAWLFAIAMMLPLAAADAEDLTKTMREKVALITDILANQSMKKEDKNSKIEASTNYLFDYKLMARLSLGKKEWNELDAGKRDEYTGLFERRIKNSYLEKLHLYTDEKVLVENAQQTKKDRIEVPSFILAKDGKTEILYKFYQNKQGTWLIYDVLIAGVSIIQTYRAQFDEILKTKNVFELIEKLKSSEEL